MACALPLPTTIQMLGESCSEHYKLKCWNKWKADQELILLPWGSQFLSMLTGHWRCFILQDNLCKILKSPHPSSATSLAMGTSLPHETAHFIVEWPKWLESGQLTLGWNLSAWQVLPLVLVHRTCLLPLPPCQPFKLFKMAIMGLLNFLFPRLNISVFQLYVMWHGFRAFIILSNPQEVSNSHI